MAIVNREHRCPICNTMFRVAYDKDKIIKGLDTTVRVLSVVVTGMNGVGGYTGKVLADEAIKGRDVLVRKLTGAAKYKFRCPRCNYETEVIY